MCCRVKGTGERAPRDLANAFKSDDQSRTMAVAVRAPFKSAFEGPLSARADFRPISSGAPQVFAIADVDWVFDPFSLQTVNVGGRAIVRPLNDNLAFLLNMVEHATGQDALSEVRTRGQLQRPFLRVHELAKAAQDQFRQEEATVVSQVASIESQMRAAMTAAGQTSAENLPPQLKSEIRTFRENLVKARGNLRDLRRQIRMEVEQLGKWLSVINVAAGPALVLVFWFAVMAYRRRRAFHVD